MPPPDPSRTAPPLAARGIVSAGTVAWIVASPIVLALAFLALFATPRFDSLSAWLVEENHPVQLLTFLSLLPAGIGALWMSRNKNLHRGERLVAGFFLLLGIGLVFTALEEVSYGQSFLDFDSPSYFAEHNLQGELTVHNLPGLQGRNGPLRLVFGLGGLVGVFATRWRRFALIAPPPFLTSWFATIAVLGGFDVFLLFHPMGERIFLLNERLTEVVEMMLGFAALLYVWLCFKRTRVADVDG